MAQFDIHLNPSAESARQFPYLLDLQGDLLSDLNTRVVAPLVEAKRIKQTINRLHPRFSIAGGDYVLLAAQMAGVPRTALGERVGSLQDRRDDIIAAIDLLITGI